MSLKLRQLSHALAVCHHGNFRRAAAEQHLSQPALSRSVQNLEDGAFWDISASGPYLGIGIAF